MAKGRGHVPRRTCIACGRVRAKDDLIRLVLNSEGHLIRDDTGRMEGRGGYSCNTLACLERIARNRYSRKAFRGRKTASVGPGLGSG